MNIKKWILFFISIFSTYCFVAIFLSIPLVVFYVELSEFFKIQYASWLDRPMIMAIIPYYISPIVTYSYAKMFGIFKDIDSLKLSFRLKLFIVTLVSSFIFVLMYFPRTFFDNGFVDMSRFYSYSAFSLIIAFLFYKLFQYLTIKLPNPFEQMAYYFSIEFYRTLIKNSYQKIKNKFTK